MTTQTTQTTFDLASAYELPGHENGRRRLMRALLGDSSCACRVTGHWENDEYIVATIEDVYDDEVACWATECGSDLYPMAVAR